MIRRARAGTANRGRPGVRDFGAGLALLALALPLLAAADDAKPAPTMAEVLAASTDSDWRTPDPRHTLYLELASGRVVIELAPEFAPRHVANIEALVRERYFDGLAILRSQDNYVVQWGDPGLVVRPARAAGKRQARCRAGDRSVRLSHRARAGPARRSPWRRLDALVFTAGIGENSAHIRQRVCEQLGWLGLKLDRAANEVHGPRIGTADSPVSAWVIATNEEQVIARGALDELLRARASPPSGH